MKQLEQLTSKVNDLWEKVQPWAEKADRGYRKCKSIWTKAWPWIWQGRKLLLAIPVVNIIACIIWIIGSNCNPNRKNFAKAWLILTVIGTILSGILAFGLFQFIVMDHPVNIHEHIEYSIPEQQFIDNFLMELNEV